MAKKERVKFTTTLEKDVISKLELIKIEKGFDGRNDAIEYLTKKYWGKEDNENSTKSSKSKKSKRVSKEA